jgi:hypothetical protein
LTLLLTLCCPALAGDMHTTLTANGGATSAQGEMSTTAASDMPNGAAGDIQNDVAGDMGNGVSPTEVVLALLGVFALP